MLRRLAPLLLAALVAGPAVAQDRAATERRLSGLRDQIQGVERQVRQTRGEEASALRALDGLEAEIQLREELVSGYRTQVGTIREETETVRRSIERLESEIEEAKRSYRRRARHAYIHGRRNSFALILSAGSVTQMLARARYLQQFAGRRRDQVERIGQKTSELRTREQEVRQSLEETQRLLAQGQAERSRLSERRRDRAGLVATLRTQRGRLERELDQRRRDAGQLEGLVQELVAQERRRAEEERQRREAAARAEAARVAEAARIAEIQRQADEAARQARRNAETLRSRPEPRGATASPPTAEAAPPPADLRSTPPAAPASRATPPPAVDRPVDLTGSFRQNRGRLPWPADGTVTGRFGTRTDPVSGTQTSARGIDISTPAAAPARAVFEGTVERIGVIPTYGTYVMIQHGEFTTIYGNLSQVAVAQGQSVRAGQVIGRAGTAEDRRGTQLFFALFQGGSAVDPLGWLRGR